MNVWNFTGHLGKDCEIKDTQKGKICVFSVGVTSGFGDKQKTTWANCIIFGKRAEGALPQHLLTGQKVAISGEMTLETWENEQGVKGSSVKVFVNSLDLMGGGQNQQQNSQNGQQNQQQARPQNNQSQQPQNNNQRQNQNNGQQQSGQNQQNNYRQNQTQSNTGFDDDFPDF